MTGRHVMTASLARRMRIRALTSTIPMALALAVVPASGLAGEGTIGGRKVRCHTAAEQLRDHDGYEPTDKDRHDVELLVEHFGLPLPEAYAG